MSENGKVLSEKTHDTWNELFLKALQIFHRQGKNYCIKITLPMKVAPSVKGFYLMKIVNKTNFQRDAPSGGATTAVISISYWKNGDIFQRLATLVIMRHLVPFTTDRKTHEKGIVAGEVLLCSHKNVLRWSQADRVHDGHSCVQLEHYSHSYTVSWDFKKDFLVSQSHTVACRKTGLF